LAYQRAKDSPDTIPFGTKRDVYSANYEVGSRGTRKRLSLLCPRCVSLPTASSLALPNCLSRSRSCVLRCSLRPTRCGPRTPRATPPRAASLWAGLTASSPTPPTFSTYRTREALLLRLKFECTLLPHTANRFVSRERASFRLSFFPSFLLALLDSSPFNASKALSCIHIILF
jgi:hypothetical protein